MDPVFEAVPGGLLVTDQFGSTFEVAVYYTLDRHKILYSADSAIEPLSFVGGGYDAGRAFEADEWRARAEALIAMVDRPVALLDARGVVEAISAGMVQRLGIEAKRLIGKDLRAETQAPLCFCEIKSASGERLGFVVTMQQD